MVQGVAGRAGIHSRPARVVASSGGSLVTARHGLRRVEVIERLLVEQVDVLETMAPQDFLAFRAGRGRTGDGRRATGDGADLGALNLPEPDLPQLGADLAALAAKSSPSWAPACRSVCSLVVLTAKLHTDSAATGSYLHPGFSLAPRGVDNFRVDIT